VQTLYIKRKFLKKKPVISGAGTNLKVGERGAPVLRKSGDTNQAERRKISCWSSPSTFLILKVQLVVLASAFVMVSTVWYVSCLLFFYSRCPHAQPFFKVGDGARAPVPHRVGATGNDHSRILDTID